VERLLRLVDNLGGARLPGAVVATLGIFLPSFVFIAIIGPLVPRMRKSEVLGAFLDEVNVGALALMVVVFGIWAGLL